MIDLISELHTADWIAIAAAIIALIGIAIASVIPYHIAVRQGTFRKPKLLATFGTENEPAPSIILLNLGEMPCKQGFASFYFLLKNNGRMPLSNISVQINISPKMRLDLLEGQIGRLYEDVRVQSIGDREILEFQQAMFAPQQGTVITLPFLINATASLTSGEKLGDVSAYITYDQGDRIEKHVAIVAVREQQMRKLLVQQDPHMLQRLHEIVHKICQQKDFIQVRLGTAVASAVFGIAFSEQHWIALDTHFKRISENLALDEATVDRAEPWAYVNSTGFGFTAQARRAFIWRLFVPVLTAASVFLIAGHLH